MNSIRDLNLEKDRLLEEYHASVRKIDARIAEIRKKRNTKLKEYSNYDVRNLNNGKSIPSWENPRGN